MPDPQRILIIKPSSLGDIVHALPVLAGLRRRYPAAHIAWLAASGFAPLLDGHPLLSEVIRFDRRRYGRMWFDPRAGIAFWRFVAELRGRRFDLVVDLQGLIRSGLIAWFSGARQRVGFADAREGARWLYSRRVRWQDALPPAPPGSPQRDPHAVEKNLALARALELPVDPPEFPIHLTPDDLAAARSLLQPLVDSRNRPEMRVLQNGLHAARPPAFVAVLPGARWESKRWPAASFAAVIDALQAAGRACVLLGAPDERPLAASIATACQAPPLDLTGQTSLRVLAALLSLSQQVVCCDSGPMHIAAALGRPIVAVFGPTNPDRTGPYAPGAQVVREALPCSPCYRRTCPLGHHACLVRLEAARVVARVRESQASEGRAPVGAAAPKTV